MGRLHIHIRQLTLASILAALTACGADEEVAIPDELRGEPACMWIMDTWVHFANGDMRLIIDEATDYTGAACVCMTEAEFESEARLDELNDMALQACEELAQQHEHEWDECQQDHDAGEWLDEVFWSAGDWEHPSGMALRCVGD